MYIKYINNQFEEKHLALDTKQKLCKIDYLQSNPPGRSLASSGRGT